MNVLVINFGSSSAKYALFGAGEEIITQGKRERLGTDKDLHSETHDEDVATILESVREFNVDAVGHRICLLYTSDAADE